MKIKIWHSLKHDDFDVTELEVKDLHRFIAQTRLDKGFFKGSHADKGSFEFIPWHKINYIQQVEEEEGDAVEKGQEPQDGQPKHP